MKILLFAFLLAGTLLASGCQSNVAEPDAYPPSSPYGLYAVSGHGTVELFWYPNPEPDVTQYAVYVSDAYAGDYAMIGTVPDPRFLDTTTRPGFTYYYYVTALDYDGNESLPSADVAIGTPFAL